LGTVATPTIFISYRHEEPTTTIARKIRIALQPSTENWGADLFMDEQGVEPGDLVDDTILGALDRTTHFIVLLTNSYWGSAYCRKELSRAVERFEQDRSVRVLFVKVEELDPAHFTFAKDRAAGRINSRDPVIQRIGDVNFLGPFDEYGRLVRLDWEHPGELGDQIGQLRKRLGDVIHK